MLSFEVASRFPCFDDAKLRLFAYTTKSLPLKMHLFVWFLMYVKRIVHAHNNFTIQYLHFLSLRNASWASKTIVGSKFASFERATHKFLIYRALQLLRLKMCNNVVHKNSTLQCKTSTITMQLWSFCTPNGVHLVSVSAMQPCPYFFISLPLLRE